MKKILVVDDNTHLLAYLEKKLADAGHEIVTASNGLSAVNLLLEITPDVICIDYFLPVLNGDKLCQLIRRMEHLKGAYVVMMSAAASELSLDRTSLEIDAVIAKGSFKDTAAHVLAAIERAEAPSSEKPGGAMGFDSVHPRQMTKELLAQNYHLQTMLDSISEGILEIHRGQIVYANPAAVTLLGVPQEQMLVTSPPDLFDEPARSHVESLMQFDIDAVASIDQGRPLQLDGRILSIKRLPFRGDPDTIILLIADVTEQVKAEKALRDHQDHLKALIEERTAELIRANEKLQRAQKMESLGLMAGGIAHDLNNILSGIVSYPELLLMDLPESSRFRRPLEAMQESGQRAVDVVADLLTVARGVAVDQEVLNLNTMVREYLGSAEHTVLEAKYPHVNFRSGLDPDLLNVNCSSAHIRKSLMNLVINAAEAIEGDGSVTIVSENIYLDSPLVGYEDVRRGEYALLTVSDDGSGISDEDLKRIFEPFYTKKIMGRSGTGLGLAIVWNTVRDHDGYVNVKSGDAGTAFELYFPVVRKEVVTERKQISMESYLGHGERILVVDDEENQREIASGLLGRLGYSVETVPSGEEAVERVKLAPTDLVILDMVMPEGMNGRETFEKLLEVYPNQKAIIASGFAETEDVREAQRLGAGRYVKKPYTIEKIGTAVKEELAKK